MFELGSIVEIHGILVRNSWNSCAWCTSDNCLRLNDVKGKRAEIYCIIAEVILDYMFSVNHVTQEDVKFSDASDWWLVQLVNEDYIPSVA